jgi:hypothetical protein
MRLPWVMHMKTDFSEPHGRYQAGESEILKTNCEAAKVYRIRHWCTIRRELRIHISWHRAGLAVSHASTVKGLNHILMLREKETRSCVLDVHTQKMMKIA